MRERKLSSSAEDDLPLGEQKDNAAIEVAGWAELTQIRVDLGKEPVLRHLLHPFADLQLSLASAECLIVPEG
ncbi:MAG TPA: hypothetical protein VE398_16670 [Acidobacteriota bacterium]|nr:hypothetical protein [Acidobacteriota bacterium]